MKEEDSKDGRRCLRGGNVGLSFSSSVWILVLLLDTGAQLAYPELRDLKTEKRLVADISTTLSCTPCMYVRAGPFPWEI